MERSTKEASTSSAVQSERDFRVVFSQLDPAVFITGDEFAELLCMTRAAFNFRLHVGKVPDPVIRENRCVRWRVSDVRGWLEAIQQVPVNSDRVLGGRAQRIIAREAAGVPRRGRPRHVAVGQ
jgi:predicted DNA-binding transcriptional regulator AlpA